jgi:hypothetical protein
LLLSAIARAPGLSRPHHASVVRRCGPRALVRAEGSHVLHAAFSEPVHPVTAAKMCAAVIARTRRANRVYDG